ncbi:hypothetical protein ACFXC8_24455 [Streptomyces sp. NPDC059441]|uniref:hypothetical protein n=1 Tax=Streptomyces sp. NPDC059441 TaxID=3346829 RepID=UPI0036771387
MADPQSNAALPAPPALPPDAPRAGVLHVRHRHTERYTVVGNHLAQHPRLSATAIGLGVHIQSLPDGASVTIKALTLRFSEGEVTIGKALRELEAAGYLVRCRVPLGGGRIATRTFFLDHPGVVRDSTRGTGSSVPAPASASVGNGAFEAAHAPMATPACSPETEPVSVVVLGKMEVLWPDRASTSVRMRAADPSLDTAVTGPAAALLARLRLADSRLLLSARDVQRLVPAVETWLARCATPDQITRTLTAGLPSQAVPIHHPARLLEYRLTTLLPPPLSTAPARTATGTPPPRPAPLATCDGCERAFRTHDPHTLCRDCRDVRTEAVGPAA